MIATWFRQGGTVILAVGLLTVNARTQTGPSISSVSGSWNHGASVTVLGANFGSKSSSSPVVWDNSSATSLTQKWDGGWPNRSANSTNNVAYRSPIRGISPPHNRVGRYLAGAHAENAGYDAGYNVMVWKARTVTFPSYTYAAWYQRFDDAWVFGDNIKTYDWSIGSEPYNLPNNWYAEYNPVPTSRTSGCSWHLNDDASSLVNSATWWGGGCTNPMAGQWVKVEVAIRWSQGTDGFVRIYDNGRQVMNYSGPTDRMAGNLRNDAIGGYGRPSGQPNNWRYFTDIYLDYSLAHVILGNAPTYAASTRRELQIPTAWSSSSISLSVNLGTFSAGETAYLYVIDAAGVASPSGLPISIGSGALLAPAAPTTVRIIS